MSEDVSRRKALSLLGAALGLALAPADDEVEAETYSLHNGRPIPAGTGSDQRLLPSRRHRRAAQPSTAPTEAHAGAAPTEFRPTMSNEQFYSTRPSLNH